MSLSKALKEKQLDVRLRDKLLAQGRLKNEELETYVKSLTDDSNKMSIIKQDNRNKNSEE